LLSDVPATALTPAAVTSTVVSTTFAPTLTFHDFRSHFDGCRNYAHRSIGNGYDGAPDREQRKQTSEEKAWHRFLAAGCEQEASVTRPAAAVDACRSARFVRSLSLVMTAGA